MKTREEMRALIADARRIRGEHSILPRLVDALEQALEAMPEEVPDVTIRDMTRHEFFVAAILIGLLANGRLAFESQHQSYEALLCEVFDIASEVEESLRS